MLFMINIYAVLYTVLLGFILLPTSTGASTSIPEPMPSLLINKDLQYSKGTFPRDAYWSGLYCNPLGCEIKPARVNIKTARAKNVLDEYELLDVISIDEDVSVRSSNFGQSNQLNKSNDRVPLALFNNLPLNVGEVVSWYRSQTAHAETLPIQKLKKLGKWHMPWGVQPLTISWVKTADGWKRYHIGDGITKQFLFKIESESHYGGDTTPIIHWVGDIDGDGKIDMLLGIPDDNCGFDERLYLSSHAGEGNFLRKAAQLHGREAACGC